ncbi:chorismate synthase [Oscillatoria amoena NRMC-F 0135]|nr:chorismate synthase [Oscillatoria amoena NRMC-F 0135]
MAGNSLGVLFRITTFGESHGEAVGAVIDGCPPLLEVDIDFINAEMARRRPGQSALTTQRNESDEVQILSGVFNGKTTGAPIAIVIPNKDQRSGDYEAMKDVFRPSHADYTYEAKYGIRDYRGGGRSSARATAAVVAAGAFAKLLLKQRNITIQAFVNQVGTIETPLTYTELDLSLTETNPVRCPHPETAAKMIALIEEAKAEGDSLGGCITCVVKGVPAGLGEPVFDKLQADLAKAMLTINATKGFEYGSGFAGTRLKGSEHNDSFITDNGKVATTTNHSGGIQGGISNGMDIYCKVAFKPTATIAKSQKTVDNAGQEVDLAAKGRHDPCVLPRAVPIVEAMAALVLADHWLRIK